MLGSVGSRSELFAAWANPDFSDRALEIARGGAEMTLDSCATGYWQNIMLYNDADGNTAMAYPVYYVSTS